MVERSDVEPSGSPAVPTTHRAARIEDWIHALRERFSRRRGAVPTIIPYTGFGTTERVRILCRVLLTRPLPAPTETSSKADRRRAIRQTQLRGWRSFVAVPLGSVPVSVVIGDERIEVLADRGGVVDISVPVSLQPGWHVAHLQTPGGSDVEAPLQVISPDAGFGIISDVDDTVMVTALPRPFVAAWNTFVLSEHARVPTPGMAVLLERLASAHPGTPVIYLSTGAWNVAPALNRFLSRNLYPAGPLLLTDWGPTHDRLFRSGREHKHDNLRRLAEEFPNIKWLLIGDDGQHDEDVYRDFVAEFPDHVAAVAIRQLSPGQAVLAGGRSKSEKPETPSVPWVYSPDGSGLATQLEALSLL
jgi:phosphatidate phosphatase APP1